MVETQPLKRLGKAPLQLSVRSVFVAVTIAAIVVACSVGMMSLVRDARRAAQRVVAQSPFNQLVLALHNYHDQFGAFPPAYLADSDGVPMHSWRVLILPYIEERNLYSKYDFSEPWNGPNNSRLLNHMPSRFQSPTEPLSDRYTNILAITGPGTAFPYHDSVSLSDIADGAENTLLLAEIADSDVLWLEPRDFDTGKVSLTVGLAQPAENSRRTEPSVISSVYWRLPYVVFGDSIHAYAVRHDTPSEWLQGLTTIDGQETISRQKLVEDGFLR